MTDAGGGPGRVTEVLRGRVVLPDDELADGVVVVRGDRIAWVGPAADATADAGVRPEELPAHGAAVLLPGLVDLHCHGGGGTGFPDVTAPDAARAAVAEHRRHGTTTLVASLVTDTPEALLTRVAALAPLAATDELAGIHLEGPFLAAERCGAQDPDRMRPGDPDLVRALAAAAQGHLVTMTVAPEVAGVLGTRTSSAEAGPDDVGRDGVVAALAACGAVPSLGHTDASAARTREALHRARDALRRALADGVLAPAARAVPTVTHLFNGMRPLHHRDPGPVAACLAAAARGEAVLELVADGVHLHPDTARAVLETVGAANVALVTDAMAATGMPDGEYVLGGLPVRVVDGVARLAAGGAIAGGTSHLLDVVRTVVASGVPLVEAVRAASLTPAEVLGRTDVGALTAGRRADVVVVDADLRPLGVLRGGRWVEGRSPVGTPSRPRAGAVTAPTGRVPTAALVPLPLALTVADDAPWSPGGPVRLSAPPGVDLGAAPGRLARALGLEVSVAAGTDAAHAADVTLRLTDEAGLGLPADTADRLGPAAPVDPAVALAASRDQAAALHQERLAEAYRLEVDPTGVRVLAVGPAGLRHGLTVLGLLAAAGPRVPALTAVDAPRYAWRGLSVDVARHFLPADDVLVLLDLLADLRLNVLHLHLTDDQGWRLDLPSRPQLAARSGGTAVDGDPGGWYDAAAWRRLVAAATARGIMLVPEVDVPGHVHAALHALPELNPDGVAPPPYTGIEVGFSRLTADLPATTPFLRDVFADLARSTPGTHLHLGGDEVLAMDREEYVRLVRTAAGAVEATGRAVVGWQEVATAPLTPGSVVQLWDEREDPGPLVAAADRGARVLLSPASRVYLDMKEDASTPLGLEWAGHVPLPRTYDWDPATLVPGLAPGHVVGVEAAIWSETTRSLDDVTTLLLPRLAAVAEVAWSAADGRADGVDGFAPRVAALARTWDAAGLRWSRARGFDGDGR
jgi:N-acetylglucosamine-6-phosphate deacetylase